MTCFIYHLPYQLITAAISIYKEYWLQNISEMFTPRIISTFQALISRKQVTQSVLCEWKPNNSLQVTKSWLKRIKFALGTFASFIYASYLTYQFCYQLVSKRREDIVLVDLLWIILWMLYFYWSLETNINLVLKQWDSVTFIKGMILLDAHIAGMQFCKIKVIFVFFGNCK
jgi:hypothetical protein